MLCVAARRDPRFYPISMNQCNSRGRLASAEDHNEKMYAELAKLAVASTAATILIWLLSLLAPRCVPEHVGYLIRLATC